MRPVPDYNHTIWALHQHNYSIVVRHDAVIRSFPGGTREFERILQPDRKSWVLYLLTVRADKRLAEVLAALTQAGLLPGRDLAVGNGQREVLTECPGIAFSSKGRLRWWVTITPDLGVLEAADGAGAAWVPALLDGALTGPGAALSGLTLPTGTGSDPGVPVAANSPVKYTSATTFTRRAERRRFVADLDGVLGQLGIDTSLSVREYDNRTSIDIVGGKLSALVLLSHRRRGEIPLIHWYGASRPLRAVPEAWTTVNSFHHRKSTSFPRSLDGVIRCLVAGLTGARDGTAFRDEED